MTLDALSAPFAKLQLLAAVTVLSLSVAAQQPETTATSGQEPLPVAPAMRVDVDLVRVALSATRHGVPVKGLGKQDFLVREDSAPQQIKYFWQEGELPLSMGLIVDVSGSQSGFISKHRETVSRFLKQVLGSQDRAMIVTVGPQARLVTDFTNSLEDLNRSVADIRSRNNDAPILGEPCKGINRRELPMPHRHGRSLGGLALRYPCGGTALWNGIYFASVKMKNVSGRKALIVFSDGWDTGSDKTLDDAIEAAQSAETPVYTIKFLNPVLAVLVPPLAFKHPMERLSDETGAMGYGMMHGDLGNIFNQIETELRNLYVIGYTPTNRARDGAFRKLEVTAKDPGVQVRTRRGYIAER